MVSKTHEIVKEESINAFGDWQLITEAFRSLDMEALYHQTNGLLSQTQGYYVRLEQVCYQNCKSNKDFPSQGGAGDDLERLEVEVWFLDPIFPSFEIWPQDTCQTYFKLQVRGRLETLWANSERLEMLASKEPVARRQVENWRFLKI